MDLVILVATLTFGVALVLSALFGAKRILMLGGVLALPVPFVLAVWDPDGPADPEAFFDLNASPGEWFVIGLVASAALYVAWALGAGLAALWRRTTLVPSDGEHRSIH